MSWLSNRTDLFSLHRPDYQKSRALVGAWDYKEWALNGGEVKAKWGLKGQK